MNPASKNSSRLEVGYTAALRLYPRAFRDRNAPAMLQAFRDALNDNSLPHRSLVPLLLRDLVLSLAKEHTAMFREIFGRPVLVFNAMILSVLATGLALALYAIPQHVLRSGANDPQIALAGDLVARLESGVAPAQAVPTASVDLAQSLSPFVIVYDDQGRPLASQAQLDGVTPVLPRGVFDFVRAHGQERLSWQPVRGDRGVRIAAIVERVQSANGAAAFVLAGRNMREVEARIGDVTTMAGLTWMGMLAVILVGTAAFGWFTRPRQA